MTSVVHSMDCMDCLRAQADKSFDLAIVDPPYGVGYTERRNKKWNLTR